MNDPKKKSTQASPSESADEITRLFAHARDLFKNANLILSEDTGRGRYAADQWFSGKRTPPPEVLPQVARNLRARALLLQDAAARFDALAAILMRQPEGGPDEGAKHRDAAPVDVDDEHQREECQREEVPAPELDETAEWTEIQDLADVHRYIDALGGAPVPGVGRAWGALSREEQERLCLRMIGGGR